MTARKRLLTNRVARWVVTVGGLAIIASILGILVFISIEVLPLMGSAEVAAHSRVQLGSHRSVGRVIADEYRERAVVVDQNLSLTSLDLLQGTHEQLQMPRSAPVQDQPPSADELGLFSGAKTRAGGPGETAATEDSEPEPYRWIAVPDGRQSIAATNGREVVILPVDFPVTFSGAERSVGVRPGSPYRVELAPVEATPTAFDAELDGDGNAVAAVAFDDGTLLLVKITAKASLMASQPTLSQDVQVASGFDGLTQLAVGSDQDVLYAAGRNSVYLWRLSEPLDTPQVIAVGGREITALTPLLGSRSVLVATADGGLEVWSRLSTGLARIRRLPPAEEAVTMIRSSPRDKGFIALEGDGDLLLMHATSERTLWRGRLDGDQIPLDLYYAPKADGLLALLPSATAMLTIDNPHPEVSWKTLFGKIWYEGYEKPDYVWQSTGGTDDFEPKLSLVPLLVGTLKGTFYSMLLAVPLAVFSAMYASQFMHPQLLNYIKPAIEVMAALPSVVLGFLAGLWLAPRLEQVLPGLILALIVMPPATLVGGWLWRQLPARWRKTVPDGFEVLWFAVVLVVTAVACFRLNPLLESRFFSPDFQTWVGEILGLTYDQRNAVVVGLAMGFAVIPIIFAISEDAFSNVPKNLTSGSLALGATRWQTVTRVVLPTASPGIFSAIMIGFGRAIGETMIVLMATGNTPIMDWNPFNGFRTLSANIAVEIPEAPQYGTLYRVLFLSGLVLFVLTFVVNTVAEVVRQRLRKKYSEL